MSTRVEAESFARNIWVSPGRYQPSLGCYGAEGANVESPWRSVFAVRLMCKVLEFVKFRERMQNSYHHLLVTIEQSMLQLKEKSNKLEEIEEQQGLREIRLRTGVQRRCLVPRLIWLSTHCMSLKETEGKCHDTEENCAKLQRLLVRYAVALGFSFDDAVEILYKIASAQKSFRELKLDMVDLITFAVFYNAWRLAAEGPVIVSKEQCLHDSSLNIDKLMELTVKELIGCTGVKHGASNCSVKLLPAGCLMPTLTRLVTEPFAWHLLMLQSCVRSKLPVGRKKKRSGVVGSHIDGSSHVKKTGPAKHNATKQNPKTQYPNIDHKTLKIEQKQLQNNLQRKMMFQLLLTKSE